jgi:hypothetical protein
MRARHFLALFAVGMAAAVGVGCDGNETGQGGAGGEGGDGGMGGSPTTTSSTTTTTTGTGGTGGMTMPQGSSCANPIELPVYAAGEQAEFAIGDLDPIDSKQEYFRFSGKKGQALYLFSDAKPNEDPFADGFPDLVVTIFNADGTTQISQNDDPIPRDTQDSSMYTVLPADGDYCLKVEEFCQVLGASAPSCNAEYFAGILNTQYGVILLDIDPAQDGNVGEPATDNDMPYDIASSEYQENDMGTGYFAISIQGSFKGANDEDVYNFTVPGAIPVAEGRETAYFELFPTGQDGNGSDTPTGLVWIEDANGNILAQVDGTKLDPIDGYAIQAPLTFGQPYSLHVQAGGTPPANGNPFYFLLHYRSGSNPVEAGDVDAMTNNNTVMTAEPLEALETGGGFPGSFVAGDIGAPGDVDYFAIGAKPNAGDLVFSTCSAQRIGSGLRNLKLTILNAANGMPISGATATETATASASLGDMGADLGGATDVILKVEATQDANVKGTYYQCGVVFIPPQP